jgi:hypothetical protein
LFKRYFVMAFFVIVISMLGVGSGQASADTIKGGEGTSQEIGYNSNDIEPVEEGAKYLDGSVEQRIEIDTTREQGSDVHPNITFYGNGGISVIDWMPGARAVYWKIDPSTLEPYVFTGKMVIYRNGKWWKSYKLSGYGAIGKSVSDTIHLPKMSKGEYKFKLSGVAVAPAGKFDIYKVPKNAVLYINKPYSS